MRIRVLAPSIRRFRPSRASGAAKSVDHPKPVEPVLGEADYRALRFAIELVDRLGIEHGFDPAELVSGRTNEPLGPFLDRLRSLVRSLEEPSQGRGRERPTRQEDAARGCGRSGARRSG